MAKYTIASGLGLALASCAPPMSATPPAGSTSSLEVPAADLVETAAVPSERPFLRGMTVSCPTWGPIWGSPAMETTLDSLQSLGVEWVSIHPYARVARDGSVTYQPAAQLEFLERAVTFTAARDQQLFWKPHLAYWGSFDWRGAIAFETEAEWRRFFDTYRAFIVDQARFAEAHGVELFSVGLEYEATTHRESDWRRIIAAVRAVYSGRLTYSANWDQLDSVPFWDALDWIGVQAYFPLVQGGSEGGSAGVPEDLPEEAALHAGWDAPLASLRALSERHGKPVLLAEIGYDLAPHAAAEPWRALSRAERGPGDSDAATRALRQRLLRVALERLPREEFLVGMFWWKWIPGRDGTRDFPMEHPDAHAALREAWNP